MNTTAVAVVLYVLWMVVLLMIFLVIRVRALLNREVSTNNFRADGSDVSPFAERLSRAHANCYESAPLILSPLLLALATSQIQITSPLALYVLAARIGQSLIHMLSTSANMVRLRFVLFLVQIVIVCIWCVQFLRLYL